SERRSLGVGRRGLAGEDVGQPVEVDLAELPLSLLLEPRDELRTQDVELAVQQAALERDLVLLCLELLDQILQLGVGEACKVRKRFHETLSVAGGPLCIEAAAAQRFNL